MGLDLKGVNMAQNDMEVIMYEILKYLYECMKTGKIPDLAEYGWE